MKNINKYICCFISLAFSLLSCTDVVDVDVPDGGSRLVVEASIDWVKGSTGENQTIKLSTSTPYFENTTNTAVTGATVLVTNNTDGTNFVFADQNNGNYTATDFVPVLNQSYTLTILYNGETYSATETLMPVSEINRVEQSVENFFGSEEIQLKVFFDDPAGENNYYMSSFWEPDESYPLLNVLEDRFTDGNENFFLYGNEDLETGNTINISLYGISETYYNFMNLLIEQSEAEGNPFQTTPAKLKGNCKNTNNPDEEVLGYFRLSEVSTVDYMVE